MNNKYKEFFIWEEKENIQQSNSSYEKENLLNNIIIETENQYVPNECRDIGREWEKKVIEWLLEMRRLRQNVYNRKSRKRHPDTASKYMRMKRKTDPIFRAHDNLRKRLKKLLNGKQLSTRSVGCGRDQLKKHLESKFQPGMTWDNHKFKGWHIDHIIPLSSAKTPEEMIKLNHYTNLQPLWWLDNIKKGGKYYGKA